MAGSSINDGAAKLPWPGSLPEQVAASHEPIVIAGKRNNAILMSQEDWSAIQETLFLLAIPGMRESIQAGLVTPVEECAQELDW